MALWTSSSVGKECGIDVATNDDALEMVCVGCEVKKRGAGEYVGTRASQREGESG